MTEVLEQPTTLWGKVCAAIDKIEPGGFESPVALKAHLYNVFAYHASVDMGKTADIVLETPAREDFEAGLAVEQEGIEEIKRSMNSKPADFVTDPSPTTRLSPDALQPLTVAVGNVAPPMTSPATPSPVNITASVTLNASDGLAGA